MKNLIITLMLLISAALYAETTIFYDDIKVLSWTDGSTCKIIHPETGREISLKLVGVYVFDITKKMGYESREYVKKLLPDGSSITIEFVIENNKLKSDEHGRLYGYIHYQGGLINSRIIQDGYAGVMTGNDIKYIDIFGQNLKFAREYNKGHWKYDNSIYMKEVK